MKDQKLQKSSKYLSIKGSGAGFKQKTVFRDNHGQNI